MTMQFTRAEDWGLTPDYSGLLSQITQTLDPSFDWAPSATAVSPQAVTQTETPAFDWTPPASYGLPEVVGPTSTVSHGVSAPTSYQAPEIDPSWYALDEQQQMEGMDPNTGGYAGGAVSDIVAQQAAERAAMPSSWQSIIGMDTPSDLASDPTTPFNRDPGVGILGALLNLNEATAIPYVTPFLRNTVAPAAGDVAAFLANSTLPAPVIDWLIKDSGLTVEEIARFYGESAIPTTGAEIALELMPGVGTVPGVRSFAKQTADDIARAAAMKAVTSLDELPQAAARGALGNTLQNPASVGGAVPPRLPGGVMAGASDNAPMPARIFNSTSDIDPRWGDEDAIRAGVPEASRGTPPATGEYLYHFTPAAALDDVSGGGLTPLSDSSLRGEFLERQRFYRQNYGVEIPKNAVYAADNWQILSAVDRDASASDWALLRFKKGSESWAKDPEFGSVQGAWFTKKAIEPDRIEVWNGQAWEPLARQSSSTPPNADFGTMRPNSPSPAGVRSPLEEGPQPRMVPRQPTPAPSASGAGPSTPPGPVAGTSSPAAAPAQGELDNLPVRPAKTNEVSRAGESTFDGGFAQRDETVPLQSLKGYLPSAADDAAKVQALTKQIAGPQGYIERLIIDEFDNVVEGQHRLAALAQLGVSNVPVTRLIPYDSLIPNKAQVLADLTAAAPKLRPQQLQQFLDYAGEIIYREGVDGLDTFNIPGYDDIWQKLVGSIKGTSSPTPRMPLRTPTNPRITPRPSTAPASAVGAGGGGPQTPPPPTSGMADIPPTPPPSVDVPTPDSVGNRFVGPLRPFADVQSEVVTSTNPAVRAAAGLTGINPSVLDTSDVGKALTAYGRQRVATDELTSTAITSALDTHAENITGRLGKVLPIDDDGLMQVSKAGISGKTPWNDVFSQPGAYNLSPETVAYIADYRQVINEVEAMRVAEGLKPRAKTVEGYFYTPRQVKGIRGIELRRPSNANLSRVYDDAIEGFANGIRYDSDPRATLELHVRNAYREIAEKQLSDALEPLSVAPSALIPDSVRNRMLSAIKERQAVERTVRNEIAQARKNLARPADTPRQLANRKRDLAALDQLVRYDGPARIDVARQKFTTAKNAYTKAMERAKNAAVTSQGILGNIEGNTIPIAKWRNRFFPREDADRLNEVIGAFGAKGTTRGPNPFASAVGKGVNYMRFLASVGDFGTPFIHGLPVLARDPVAWGKATGMHYRAFLDPSVQAKFIKDHAATFQEMASHGVPIGDPEFFAATKAGGGITLPMPQAVRKVTRGIAQQTTGRFASSYGTFLGDSRALLWESSKLNPTDRAHFIRNLTGGLDTRALGVSPSQREVEGMWLAFSPRLMRSTLALVKDAANPTTPVGREAFRTLASLATGATGIYVATGLALGKEWSEIEEGLNPLSGKKFLSHEVDGHWIGIGGHVRALTQLMVGVAVAPQNLAKWDRFDNPLMSYVLGRGAPGINAGSAVIEAGTGLNANPYEEIDGSLDLAQFIGKSSLPFAAQSIVEGQGIGAVMAGFGAGMRTSKLTTTDESNQASQSMFGKDYDALNSREQATLNAKRATDGEEVKITTRMGPWWEAREDALADIKRNMPAEIADAPLTKKALTVEDYSKLTETLVKWEMDTYKLTKSEADEAVAEFLKVTQIEKLVREYREDVLRADPGLAQAWKDAYDAGKTKWDPSNWVFEFVDELEGATP